MEQKLDNISGKTLLMIIVLILVGVLSALSGYYFGQRTGWDKGYQSGYNEGSKTESTTCDLEVKDAVSNPMDNMPNANPFEESVNPFK